MKNTYKNRYGDEFTFEKTDDGNILWKGDFTYCRIGYPNDYTSAYNAYIHDHKHVQDLMSFNQFKDVVHEYDDENQHYTHDKYLRLVETNTDVIDMVDPSGGCYISSGMNLSFLGFPDSFVKEFKQTTNGFEIILEK